MVAFLAPVVMSALLLLARHFSSVASVTRFPDLVHNHAENMVLGILAYLPVAAIVPLALYLLDRTGQSPTFLGLGAPKLKEDLWPGMGLAAAAFGTELLLLVPLSIISRADRSLFTTVKIGHVPAYYVIWGLAISIITAIAEEVLVNGYLTTRLGQLGWTARSALVLSLVLRTSYHVYYGLGFILTIPFGFYVTRSFQKHRRLNRAIAAHFIFDATLFTLSILH